MKLTVNFHSGITSQSKNFGSPTKRASGPLLIYAFPVVLIAGNLPEQAPDPKRIRSIFLPLTVLSAISCTQVNAEWWYGRIALSSTASGTWKLSHLWRFTSPPAAVWLPLTGGLHPNGNRLRWCFRSLLFLGMVFVSREVMICFRSYYPWREWIQRNDWCHLYRNL